MEKTKLAPGFRFHPTDIELVIYYLKRKVLGRKIITNAISELDIYKFEPPDLPDKSCLRTGDLKWYFFCLREIKYRKSGKAKRSTESGYWKVTGKDRDVCYDDKVVGKIRTLVFHYGKIPRGDRTDWIIHEYRLEDNLLKQKNIPQDGYVLCVLFKKNGFGPTRPGSQYGAPYRDEDWSNDEEEVTENLAACTSKETGLVVDTASNPQDCFAGVVSDSCVSDVPPSLTSSHLLEVPQAPPQEEEDDFYSMLDRFVVDNNEEFLVSEDNNTNQHEVRNVPVLEETLMYLADDDFSGTLNSSNDLFIELQDLIEPSSSTPAQAGDSRSNKQT